MGDSSSILSAGAMNRLRGSPSFLVLALLGAGGCGPPAAKNNGAVSAASPPAAAVLPVLKACGRPLSFTENFVRVELAAARDERGAPYLRGRFMPERPGDHLYSKDLPADGIDGAGRPTRLRLDPPESAAVGAALTADQPLHDLIYPGFSRPFPVYPDGPVELRLALAATTADRPVTVHVSYMACSSGGGCLPPVDDHAVPLVLPALCP